MICQSECRLLDLCFKQITRQLEFLLVIAYFEYIEIERIGLLVLKRWVPHIGVHVKVFKLYDIVLSLFKSD